MRERGHVDQPGGAAGAGAADGARRRGLLAGMRIRKKMIVLHTVFSLVLAGALALALRRAVNEVVTQAEVHEAKVVVRVVMADHAAGAPIREVPASVTVRVGTRAELGLTEAQAESAQDEPEGAVVQQAGRPALVVAALPAGPGGSEKKFVVVSARLEEARTAALKLYIVLLLTLLAIYGLVAAALETLVLPQHVYGPIERMIEADRAVREGDRAHELIPEKDMPADELGGIMRSRNLSIAALREHERALAGAYAELERVAGDLSKKNHLLETARRNLADADRLASLGMMSAGIAHELNTPLAVLKGLVEKLNAGGGGLSAGRPGAGRAGGAGASNGAGGGVTPDEAALMLRVVRRLERLSESLLDFARARPASVRPADLAALVEEARTLVRLDRVNARSGEPGSRPVEFVSRVAEGTSVECDPDRITQVLVNLLRNAAEAAGSPRAEGGGAGLVEVDAERTMRDGARWVTLSIRDNGPGIDPAVLSRLFEPFATTKLDARGTGLGLAVSQGIVREHAGLLTARNRESGEGGPGAVFEVMLPERAIENAVGEDTPGPGADEHRTGEATPQRSRSGQ
jgi:signal transduction histidine kinase